jgi:RNA polymerase sigma-70 factor (ECF subfamily)
VARRHSPGPERADDARRPSTDGADLDDRALVAAAQGGDRGALDALLRRHADRIFAICRRLTGNQADAADAAQEAMIALVRGLDRYDGRAAFTTWAYRVTTNACLDELRRRGRRPDPGLPEIESERAAGQPRLDQTVADRLSVDDAMAGLAPEFRVAVVLRDVVGLDYAEIAEVLDIPPGTVRSRIARGRAQLAAVLGSESGNPVGRHSVQGTPHE